MPMTVVEKILARASGRDAVRAGDVVEPAVDLAMSHENAALVLNQFHAVFLGTNLEPKIWDPSKIAIIFIGTFFQMVLMVAEDVRRVPAAQVEAAQTMGANRSELIEKVIFPSAKPALLDTMRITMGWAWTYLVVAELVAANSGLGYAILRAQRFLQTDTIFAGIIVIGLIGLVTDQLFRWGHRRAFPWLYLKG